MVLGSMAVKEEEAVVVVCVSEKKRLRVLEKGV